MARSNVEGRGDDQNARTGFLFLGYENAARNGSPPRLDASRPDEVGERRIRGDIQICQQKLTESKIVSDPRLAAVASHPRFSTFSARRRSYPKTEVSFLCFRSRHH